MKHPCGRLAHLSRLACIGAVLVAGLSLRPALADGLALDGAGRLKAPGLELAISRRQQAQIEFIDRCHRDNHYSPYLFRLEPAQTAALKAHSGIEARRLVVYETRGIEPAPELTVNAALRIAEDRIEVSLDELYDEAGLRGYEHEVIGWSPNPIGDRAARVTSPDAACDTDPTDAWPAGPE